MTSLQGRPREFEIDDAVDAAMEVFWSRGYNATSLVDLIDGTGLSRGSLYKAFGDKHGLFIAALERYISNQNKYLTSTLNKLGSTKSAIQEALSYVAQISCNAEGRRQREVFCFHLKKLPRLLNFRQVRQFF